MNKKRNLHWVSIGIILVCLGIIFFRFQEKWETRKDSQNAAGDLKVHFMNIGQSESILIQSGGKNLLIDGGTNSTGGKVVEYLRQEGITYLDYVVGTHGHEDHIGGIDAILYNFQVGELFLPKQTYSTHTYRDILEIARVKHIPIIVPRWKEIRMLGKAKMMFLSPEPNKIYEDINDSSLVLRISNGKHSFLFCGDISKKMEKRILRTGAYLKSDVLKLNHHGSNDANSMNFLKKVSPKYAVVCCAKKNDFGHPHKTVLKRLQKRKIQLFRTDEQGEILFISDGKILRSSVKPIR
ncbi:ComEC/Rec2 family competence protein [Faecalimonas sp.]